MNTYFLRWYWAEPAEEETTYKPEDLVGPMVPACVAIQMAAPPTSARRGRASAKLAA
jgi:hypothetical protein